MSEKYIYCLKNEAGEVVYIGATNNPLRRKQQHGNKYGKCLLEILLQPCSEWSAKERQIIEYYETNGNIKNISWAGNNKYFCKYKSRRK